MRHILVDQARRRHAAKRGDPVTLAFDPGGCDPALHIDVLLVHNALERFAGEYPRQARVVELRFFGGVSAEECADVLSETGTPASLRTVERDWAFAKAWLQDAIGSR